MDEAWTHGGTPAEIGRYWCFYGALFGESAVMDSLDTEIRAIKARHGHKDEVKWSNLNLTNVAMYRELKDAVFTRVRAGSVRFRQMLCDRSIVRVPEPGDPDLSELDVQFRLCYQFVKHSFGLKLLPFGAEVLVRSDTHSSQKHLKNLESYGARIPGLRELARSDISLKLTFHRSTAMPIIQLVDLLIGAAGFYGNKMYLRRLGGARRIKPKQAMRRDFAKEIFCDLRTISNAERCARAFNWFESTGAGGIADHALNQRIRVWKFFPKKYRIDKGWQNDHLDKFGQYVAADFEDHGRTLDDRLW
jgi:hypothetical protein